MTIGHCIVLYSWGSGGIGNLSAGQGQSLGGDQLAKSPENSGNTAFLGCQKSPRKALLLFIFSSVLDTNSQENLLWNVPWLTSCNQVSNDNGI